MWNVGGRGGVKAKLANNGAHNIFSLKTSLLIVVDYCKSKPRQLMFVLLLLFFFVFLFIFLFLFYFKFSVSFVYQRKKNNVRLVISWGGVRRHGKEDTRNSLLFISGSKAYA